MLLKAIKVKNVWFATIGIFMMGSNFKIPFVMFILVWWCCVLILAILLLSIITVKGADDRFVIHDIGKSEAIHLLEISVLEDCTYIKEIIIEKVRN